MPTPKEQIAADLYAKLKPQALGSATRFIMSNTPANIQTEMAALIQSELVIPPGSALVADGQSVPITENGGFGIGPLSPGTLVVTGTVVSSAKMAFSPTQSIVSQNQAVVVEDTIGVANPGSPGVVYVTNGSLAKVVIN